MKELSVADVYDPCIKLAQSLDLERLATAAVLCNYYGRGSMLGGIGTYSNALDISAPSTKLRALESLTHTNAIGSVIDTALSQLVRTPNWRVQTIGSNWEKQRSCRKIEQWIAGSLTAAGVAETKWQVVTDSTTCPVAGARLWMEDDGLHVARVRPDHIIYNPREGKKPRNLWLRYPVPRVTMVERFPKFKDAIKTAGATWRSDTIYDQLDLICDVDADLVEVVEHWQLGSGGEDGCYSILCGGEILNPESRAWKHKFHGVVELTWKPSWDSFAGQSLGSQLLPYQVTLNRMNRVIDTAQAKMSIARILLPKGSEVDKAQFSRSVGEFIDFNPAGGEPVIRNAQAIAPEYYNRLDQVLHAMYELAGVSESQAHGTIPAGMAGASGKALAQLDDKASTRLKSQADRIDRWDERLATCALGLAIDWFKADGKKKTKGAKTKSSKSRIEKSAGTKVLQQVDFSELKLEEDDGIEIRCKSIGDLPNHPAARLAYVQDLLKSNIVNPRYAAKLLSIADSEAWEDSITAAFDLATDHIESVLYDKKQVSPEPNAEYLEILEDMGTRELLKAVRMEAPEENVEMLRRLLEVAQDQMKKLGKAGPTTDLSAGGVPAMAPPDSPLGAAMAAPQVPQAVQPVPGEAARWA